jgi:hypothetical protein
VQVYRLSPTIDRSRVAPKVLWGSGLLASLPALLLFSVWNKIFAGQSGLAVLSTWLSWLWMTVIFISAVLLWQGKENRFFGLTSYIICLSTALSGFWLLVFYPAVMSVDSLVQWQQALANRYSTWHTPLLPMLMHITQYLAKTPSLFSFIQGSLFWGALFFLIRQVAKGNRAFLIHTALVILLPPLWLYSNAIVSMTWGAVFLMLAMAFLIRSVKGQREIPFYLSVLSLSVAVMFRREAVLCVIVPIVTYLLFLKRKSGLVKKAIVTAIIIVGTIIPGRVIEFSPNVVRVSGSQSHGLFNQYVGTMVHSMRLMKRAEIDKERQSIDREFGKGVFRKLIWRYDCRSADYIIYNRHFPRVIKIIPKEKNLFVLKKVVQTALRHPGGYLKHQVCYLGHLSQFSKIAYQSWGVLKKEPQIERTRAQLGIAYNTQLPSIRAGYVKLMNASLGSPAFSLIYRHYIFLLFSAIFLGLGFFRRKMEWIIPSLFCLVYVFAFLLAGPAGLWRYLLPSYLGAWACLPAVLSSIFRPARKQTKE